MTGLDCPVTSVAYSPDGKHIVSGLADSTVTIWDADTGEEVSFMCWDCCVTCCCVQWC
jgi:WD40 repeat protein